MAEFAHTYDSEDDVTINDSAAFTIVLYPVNGKVQTVDSDEMPALKDEDTTISKAMFAINEYGDHCEVYHYGEYYGKAEHQDHGWFDTEVEFSKAIW